MKMDWINTRIGEIMISDPPFLDIDDPFIYIASIFEEPTISHAIVLDGNTLVGIISRNDLNVLVNKCSLISSLRPWINRISSVIIAKDIMSKHVKTIREDEYVVKAMEFFSMNAQHALVVVDSHNQVSGLLTIDELVLKILKPIEC